MVLPFLINVIGPTSDFFSSAQESCFFHPPSSLFGFLFSAYRSLCYPHAIAFEAGLLDIIDILSTDFSVGIQAVIENAKDNIITTVSTLSDTINLVDTKYVACLAA